MAGKTIVMGYEDLGEAIKHYLVKVGNPDSEDLGCCLRAVPREGHVAIVFSEKEVGS